MTLTKSIKIAPDALAIIGGMEWTETPKGVAGRITGGQLERKLYEAVNKGLDALGGKWNRSAGAHLFAADPRPQVAAMLGSGVVVVERDGFFRTPAAVVEQMMDMFNRTVETPILEPSAGDGAICDYIEGSFGKDSIHVVEKNDQRRSVLADKGYTVVGDDFLVFEPDELYPTIVMNPPFEQFQDIDHITHAFYNCLAPGGQLVSVVGEGAFFRDERKARQFRELVDGHGYSKPLPNGSFSSSGTGVNARLVYLRR